MRLLQPDRLSIGLATLFIAWLLTAIWSPYPALGAPSSPERSKELKPKTNQSTGSNLGGRNDLPANSSTLAANELSTNNDLANGGDETSSLSIYVDANNSLRLALDQLNSQAIDQSVAALSEFRLAQGLDGLEYSASAIVATAQQLSTKGRTADAKYLVSKAIELAPTSGLIALRSFAIATNEKIASPTTLSAAIAKDIRTNPEIVLRVLGGAMPILVYICTITLFITFALYLLGLLREILSAVYQVFQGPARGLVTPFAAAAVFIIPLFFGPLWSIALWSVVILLLLQRRTILPILAGLMITGWGILIPMHISLNNWLDDPRIHSLLRAAAGNSLGVGDDLEHIYALLDVPGLEGAANYAIASTALRRGDLQEATFRLEQVDLLLGEQSWTLGQRCLITLNQGDTKKAESLCKNAYELGLRSPDFLFHYSRILFALLDAEGSRALLEEAQQIDQLRTETLMNRERSQGDFTVPILPAPLSFMLQLPLNSATNMKDGFFRKIPDVMLGMTPLYLIGIGISLLLASLVLRSRLDNEEPLMIFERHSLPQSLRKFSALVPGSGWTINESPLLGWIILTIAAIMVLPVLGVPEEVGFLPVALGIDSMVYMGLVVAALLPIYIFGGGPRRSSWR